MEQITVRPERHSISAKSCPIVLGWQAVSCPEGSLQQRYDVLLRPVATKASQLLIVHVQSSQGTVPSHRDYPMVAQAARGGCVSKKCERE